MDNSKKKDRAQFRPVQYHNFTGCTSKVIIREQKTGNWVVRTCRLDHVTSTGVIAHATGGKIYAQYPRVKQKADNIVKDDIIKLSKVNAPPREIAEHASNLLGLHYTTTDIRNRILRYNTEIQEKIA